MPSIARERLDPVADERRAAHRRGHLPALDQVALGDAEDEVAGGGLHLAAAERDRVQPALDLADQLLGRGVPGAKKVFVMRGTGRWRNDSRRPLPVDSTPSRRARRRS